MKHPFPITGVRLKFFVMMVILVALTLHIVFFWEIVIARYKSNKQVPTFKVFVVSFSFF